MNPERTRKRSNSNVPRRSATKRPNMALARLNLFGDATTLGNNHKVVNALGRDARPPKKGLCTNPVSGRECSCA